MKKNIIITVILVFIVLSCKKNKEINSKQIEKVCETQYLGLDTIYKYYIYEGTDDPFFNRKWYWYEQNDTLEIAGSDLTSGVHMYFVKNNGCVEFYKMRYIEFDDNIIVGSDGNIISGGYSDVAVFYNDQRQLLIQEYIEDSIFVGQVGNYDKFWMEFKPENNVRFRDWN